MSSPQTRPPFPPRLALLLVLLLACCARLPAEEARASAAGRVASQGFAAISLAGLPLGSAVAVAPGRLLTNAHILPQSLLAEETIPLLARRGDGLVETPARILARSPLMDLAVLGVAEGLFEAPPIAASPAPAGAMLWALGAPAAGPALAQGTVAQASTSLAGRGPGLTARLGALMGYSGGPVLDAEGHLQGLVTALLDPGAAPLLAALVGIDLAGLTQSGHNRLIFVLSIEAALAESERIAPSGPLGERNALTQTVSLAP